MGENKKICGTVPNNAPDLCDRIKSEQMFNFKDGGIDRCDIDRKKALFKK